MNIMFGQDEFDVWLRCNPLSFFFNPFLYDLHGKTKNPENNEKERKNVKN